MTRRIYRLGIIGTGRIAHRFVPEARLIDGIEVVAVYNPRITSAEKFAEECNIGFFTDELDDFIAQVDAVYIASPHDSHVGYCRQMLLAGKHVLCEKPMSFSAQEVLELKQLADVRNLIIMEAVKTAYCPGFLALLELVDSGKIGDVVDIEAGFTKLVSKEARELSDEKYGGSFFELGTYVLLPIMKILGMSPNNVCYWFQSSECGLDTYTKIHMDYGSAYATGKVGLGVKSEGALIISGTKGYIRVPAPWWLTKCMEVHFEDSNATEYYEYPFERDGLRYEIKAFLDNINGIKRREGVTLEESAWIAALMNDFRNQRNMNLQREE